MELDAILQRKDIWRASQLSTEDNVVTTGFSALDKKLPGGGWPRGALTELLTQQQGIGALRLLMPALAQLSQEEDRWICWVAPPYIPYAPALIDSGVDLSRVLLVHPNAHQDGLWAIEQSLQSGTCSAVLAWPTLDDVTKLRRLQLAAEAGDALGFLFRPQRLAKKPSPAAVRLLLESESGGCLSVSVIKRRGGCTSDAVQLNTSLSSYGHRNGADSTLALHSVAATTAGSFYSQLQ